MVTAAPIQGKTTVNYSGAKNSDIVKTILSNYNTYKHQGANYTKYFDKGNVHDTSKAIWNYLRSLNYKKDNFNQDIKTPNALAHYKTGDCKSYTLFTCSVLNSIGINCIMRFTGYDSNGIPSHVYAVAIDEKGNKIPIDGVIANFNYEVPYKHKQDYYMNVRTISGVDDKFIAGAGIGKTKLGKLISKGAKVVTAPVRLPAKLVAPKVVAKVEKAVTNVAQKVNTAGDSVIKKAVQVVKGGTLAVPRNAFLALIRLNLRKLGTNMHKAIQKDPNKVKKFWQRFGGDFDVLKRNAEKAYNKREARLNKNKINGIGGEPVTTAAVIASATPVLIAAIALFKDMKVTQNADELNINQDIAEAQEMIDPEGSEESLIEKGSQILESAIKAGSEIKRAGGTVTEQKRAAQTAALATNTNTGGGSKFSISPTVILTVAASGAALYFVSSK